MLATLEEMLDLTAQRKGDRDVLLADIYLYCCCSSCCHVYFF